MLSHAMRRSGIEQVVPSSPPIRNTRPEIKLGAPHVPAIRYAGVPILIVVRGGVSTRKARTESCSRSHATRAMQMATCATFGFDEPDQFAASARGARLGFLVTARGRYRADLTRINFDQLWVQRTRQSLPFVAR